jgi:hypothetical protein
MASRDPRGENLTGILRRLAAMAPPAVEDLFLKLAHPGCRSGRPSRSRARLRRRSYA